MYEAHVYLAEGDALPREGSIRPIGERHPLIIFVRQHVNTDHDLKLCEDEAYKIGWGDLEIKKAGIARNLEAIKAKGIEYQEAYETAMSEGAYLFVVGGIFERNY